MSYIPKGCDQQGRVHDGAHCATEVGQEHEEPPKLVNVFMAMAVATLCICVALLIGEIL